MPNKTDPLILPGTTGPAKNDKFVTVSVIIPTKDRPEYLAEAITSALNQSHAPTEIIVVDDGSAAPVNGTALTERYGSSVRTIRNERSRGLAYSRNRGVEEATSEYVIHLDDDDRLAQDAIKLCASVLTDLPGVDMAMFCVEGFGPHAEHFNRVQNDGVARVINLANGLEVHPNLILFDRRLFPALLKTVPSSFQRVMIKKSMWETISALRWQVYRLDSSPPDIEKIKLSINGSLRDSEWARYAAIFCKKIALIKVPLYFARCAGQGYSSHPSNRKVHMMQELEILRHLRLGTEAIPALAAWKREVRDALGRACFDIAYHGHQSGDTAAAWKFLKEAMSTRPRLKYLRLAFSICMPHKVRHDD